MTAAEERANERAFWTQGSRQHSSSSERVLPSPASPMSVAHELVADCYRVGSDMILRHWRGDFYHYQDGVWVEVEERSIRKQVYDYLESALYEKGGSLVPWNPTTGKVNNVLDSLRAKVYLGRDIEAPNWLEESSATIPAEGAVVVSNGVLHVPSRRLVAHTPAFWAHNRLPFPYIEQAPTPSRWLAFLAELWGRRTYPASGFDELDTLQEVLGYFIGGDTRQQKIILLVGPKRSGKGTIARVLTGLLGKHNVAAPTLASLGTNFGLQAMVTRPLAIISDARLSSRADPSIVVERLLSVSGEDSMTVDRKYRDPWTGRLPTRFLILTNELPKLADSSGALAGRLVLLTLTRSFFGQENPRLTDELLEEAPAILNWALEGLDRLNRRGYFVMPASSEDIVRQMEDLASPVGAFIRSRCEVGPDFLIPVDELWKSWRDWCQDQNLHPGTKALLGRDLKAAVPTIHHARPRTEDDKRLQVYNGIRLARETTSGHGDRPDQASTEDVGIGQDGQADQPVFSAEENGVQEEVF
ncbi:MAG: NTP-binding protein [Dehalococcoidia bacterium]|nr:NTP-binding protein [Dehalococcoidia bacterium]